MAEISGGRLESVGEGLRYHGAAVAGAPRARLSQEVGLRLYRDELFGGADYIAGTVTINDTPRLAYVRVHDHASTLTVCGGWTLADGTFRFDGISLSHRFYIIAFDPVTGEQAVIFDRI